MTRPFFSIVIPCWNDGDALASLLPRLREIAPEAEIIVGDASTGEQAGPVARLCQAQGARLIASLEPNRGRQMNAAAHLATGDILLFQHADSALDRAHLDALLDLAANPEMVGGGFHRKFDSRHPWLRWLEIVNRWLNRHGGTIFGDQSIFVRREVFQRMGGFADLPLMEDVEFSRRLRKAGPVTLLDPPLSTSPRRSSRRGSWRTSVENGLLLLLFRWGVSPARLHAYYYRRRSGAG